MLVSAPASALSAASGEETLRHLRQSGPGGGSGRKRATVVAAAYFPGVAEKTPAVCLPRWRLRRRGTEESQRQCPSAAVIGFPLKVHINQAGRRGEASDLHFPLRKT